MIWPPPGWTKTYPGDSWQARRGGWWLSRWRDQETKEPRYKLSRINRAGDCVAVVGVYGSLQEAVEKYQEVAG